MATKRSWNQSVSGPTLDFMDRLFGTEDDAFAKLFDNMRIAEPVVKRPKPDLIFRKKNVPPLELRRNDDIVLILPARKTNRYVPDVWKPLPQLNVPPQKIPLNVPPSVPLSFIPNVHPNVPPNLIPNFLSVPLNVPPNVLLNVPPIVQPLTAPPATFEPANQFGVKLLSPFKLYPHQIEAIEWGRKRESTDYHGIQGGILALSVGMGKTITSLSIIMASHTPGQMATLVITPKSLMMNYLTDMKKFFGDSMRGYVLDREVDKDRFFRFSASDAVNNHVIILSYDTVVAFSKASGRLTDKAGNLRSGNAKLKEVGERFYAVQWYRVVCDESHRLSNHKTQYWESLFALQRGKRLLLTGTVIRSYEDGLFAQLRIAGMNILENARQWTIQNFEAYKLRETLYVKSQDEADLKLPPNSIERIHVTFSDVEQTIYEIMLAKGRKTLEAFNAKAGVGFANVLEQFTRLRQACIAIHMITPDSKTKKLTEDQKQYLVDGSILGDTHIELERIVRDKNGPCGLQSSKIRKIIELAKNVPTDQKLIVFSQWATSCSLAAQALAQTFGDKCVLCVDGELNAVERDTLFQTFRTDGAVRILCMTSVGSEGLTLTEANHMIIIEPGFTSFTNEQAIGRINRIGQKRPTYVYELIVENSIEYYMLEILSKKHNIKEVLLNGGVNGDVIAAFLGEGGKI